MEDLLKLQYSLQQDKVEAALEMSKRGGHLWIFMERPTLARECRIYIYNLALRLGVRIKGGGLAEGIEIFPKHDELREGEFGNAIRGPLGIHRGANRRYWFYGADYDLEKQMAYLNRLRKVTEEQLRNFIAGKTLPPEFERKCASTAPIVPFVRSSGREFRILEHVGKVRKVGRNYVTRCPSCADAGQDRSGDNLAISIEDPRKYICWAGCTKEMIRRALGQPIPTRRSA
jgi:TOTE conflict system, Archaeo-Eukaryotic Primase domain